MSQDVGQNSLQNSTIIVTILLECAIEMLSSDHENCFIQHIWLNKTIKFLIYFKMFPL